MTDKESLVIDVTPEKKARLEILAHEHGYDTPGEYLLALIDALDDEPTKEDLLANLHQGLKEAIRGEVYPIDTLWDGIDDESILMRSSG